MADIQIKRIKREIAVIDIEGTAPLIVASTTKVANLNADQLDDEDGAYYATFEKSGVFMDPLAAQTGPASRNDSEVVRSHIELLNDNPELQKLYTFVSDSITNHFRS